MGRILLDCRTMQVGAISEKLKERIDKTLDKLNIPKDATVQLNLGTKVEEMRKENKWTPLIYQM